MRALLDSMFPMAHFFKSHALKKLQHLVNIEEHMRAHTAPQELQSRLAAMLFLELRPGEFGVVLPDDPHILEFVIRRKEVKLQLSYPCASSSVVPKCLEGFP
jgi:hypothetical protein